jgi:hypothetical protein
MTKYVISVATELEGHAGSSAHYLQVENRLTREDKLKVIAAIFGGESKFVEHKYRAQNEGDMIFYGEVVDTFTIEGKTYEDLTPVSISMIRLPSRIEKNKLFGTEARTG